MECIYVPDFNENLNSAQLSLQESQHIKALRLKPSERVFVTNGDGITATATVFRENNIFHINNFEEINFKAGELDFKLALAIGALDNRERLEFALEKSVELGVAEFYILQTQFSSLKKYSSERLLLKSIAAMKQCRRSFLPKIYNSININNTKDIFNKYSNFILADENGTEPLQSIYNTINPTTNNKNNKNTLIFIGPEGGFSQHEISYLTNNFNINKIKLANRRLRAETAAISALTLYSF